MKQILILTTFFMLSQHSFGQDQSISDWRKAHAHTLIFSQQDFDALSDEKQQRISKNAIVMQSDELSWDDIIAFEEKNNTNAKAYTIDPNHEEEIKLWMAQHVGAKILTKEYFSQLSPERKEKYLQYDTLIIGENVLTLEDIERHEKNY